MKIEVIENRLWILLGTSACDNIRARIGLDGVPRYPVTECADRESINRQEYAFIVVANGNCKVAMHVHRRPAVMAFKCGDPRCARAMPLGEFGEVALQETWRSDRKHCAWRRESQGTLRLQVTGDL